MTRSLSRRQSVMLGLAVTVGLALLCWALFRIGDRQRLWADTAELRAGFNSVNGIEKGTPIRVRGIEAGQVVGVEPPAGDDPDGKVYLRLRIDKKYLPMLASDAKARVLSEGMLGGRVIDIDPGKDRSRKLSDGDEIAALDAQDLADVMQEASKALQDIRDSNGTLAKLVKSDEAHKEVVQLVRDTQEMVKRGQQTFAQAQDIARKGEDALTSVKQDADAIKKLPIIRGYVEDQHALLYRPQCHSDRRVFTSISLFEPGRAALTPEGRQHLLNLAPWFEALKLKDSEIVVASYAENASAELPPQAAQTLTTLRSEAVSTFLKDSVRAHRLGYFTSRNVVSLGMGVGPPPVPEKEPLPSERTEIIIFWGR